MKDGIAIEAENLTKTYGDFTAISGINLKVRNGDFMGLVGPNGAGKSTTLKAITGLLKPTSGTVRISGIDIKDHRHAMENVGCVIETPEPYPGFTPAEVMEYIGRIYGMDRREIAIRSRDVLESVKMWEWRNRTISGFSKGMRQRIVIAQALLPNPEIIILDEPTSGLDPRGMVEMRRVLQNLKTRDRTLLISTHILSEVSELCGSVTMIRDGTVIASGDVSTLIHSRGYSGSTLAVNTMVPISAEALKDLSGMEGVKATERKGGCTVVIAFNGTPEQQIAVTKALFDSGAGVLSINETGATLESMYMELTEGDSP
ncbi:MAG: ABC transporter ATP-binding protein [Candidatus Methanomethylophilaceae archaeon]|nr:ABC transporter ATP-binding protein [Candidatus Methanomethylophilaceae archaeon]